MNNQFKVYFVIPPIRNTYGDERKAEHPHVGIGYICAVLKRNGINYKIFDMRLGYKIGETIDAIEEYNPDLICMTSYSFDYLKSYDVIKKIKENLNIPVLYGGAHVSALRTEVLKGSKADFAIFCEGEETIIDFINEFQKSEPNFAAVHGLIWREGGSIICNKEPNAIKDLDNLPFPIYEDFELEKYSYYNVRRMPIITSRGCPHECIYCSVRLSMKRGFRPRSPENVVDEIEYWYRKGWTHFDFYDDTFTLDLNRARKICALIIERGLKINFYLGNGIRADRVDKDLLEKMKAAGCKFLAFGCESGNEEVLKVIKKRVTKDIVRKANELATEVGISHATNFIIGHPTETYEKAMDTVNFAKELKTDEVFFYNLIPYPGTELYNWIIENPNARFIYPYEVYLNDISYRQSEPVFETNEFTVDERKKVLKLGFLLEREKTLKCRFGDNTGTLIYLFLKNDMIFNFIRPIAYGKYTSKILRILKIKRA